MNARKVLAVFLKVIILSVILAVCISVGGVVSGIGRLAPAAPPAAVEPGKLMQMLLLSCLLQAAVLSFLILRSRWSGWKLVGAVFVAFFGASNLVAAVEAAVYLPTQLPSGMVPRMTLMGMISAATFAPIAVLLLGKMRRGEQAEITNVRLVMPPVEWAWKLLTIALGYLAVYFSFGYFIAWQNPDVRHYYGGTDPGTFLRQIAAVWSNTPWMFPFQMMRAMLHTASALPVIRMLKGKPRETALAVALQFSILGGVQLILPNPFMPELVARTHLVEVLTSNFLFGYCVGWLMSRSHSSLSSVFRFSEA